MISIYARGPVSILTIARHERRNALDIEHCSALLEAAESARRDGARCLVITGDGSTFSAGADLDAAYDDAFRTALYVMLHGITRIPIPVVAAVNGPAIGAGTQLAIACDLRVVAPTASFAVPTARNGLAVDSWSIRRLAALAGAGRAGALLLGVQGLDAETALAAGLADRPGELPVAIGWATELAALAPLALAYAKQALQQIVGTTPDPALAQAFDACWASADVREAQQARSERRPAVFQGR